MMLCVCKWHVSCGEDSVTPALLLLLLLLLLFPFAAAARAQATCLMGELDAGCVAAVSWVQTGLLVLLPFTVATAFTRSCSCINTAATAVLMPTMQVPLPK
jgi:hypothetical protein